MMQTCDIEIGTELRKIVHTTVSSHDGVVSEPS